MANMSYCRFENTYKDLRDCFDALVDGEELSETEQDFSHRLIDLCGAIYEEFKTEESEDKNA